MGRDGVSRRRSGEEKRRWGREGGLAWWETMLYMASCLVCVASQIVSMTTKCWSSSAGPCFSSMVFWNSLPMASVSPLSMVVWLAMPTLSSMVAGSNPSLMAFLNFS